jgi:tripartite-type tricarboxylate transporter receptor subunit TctC
MAPPVTDLPLHVATELFRTSAGIKITHVPYKSVPASEMDLIGGQIQMMIGNFATMATHVQSGKIPCTRHHRPQALAPVT